MFALPPKNIIILRVQDNLVLVHVCKELICTENLRDFEKLVIVVVSMKERFLAEDLQRGENR